MTVTRRKPIKDPITEEVVAQGPKEIYVQERRDYDEHPMTLAETKQREKWKDACRLTSVIIRDKSHPRFMELYHRWREHLKGPEPHKQFPPFVRSVLLSEQ